LGKTINAFKTLDELKVFFDQQHDCDMLEKRILKNDENNHDHKKEKKGKKATKKHKKNDDDDAEKHGKGDRKPSAKPTCSICGKIGHRDENCWTLDKNAKKRPASFQTTNSILKKSKYAKKKSGSSTEAHFTEEQVSVMMGQVMASMKEKYGGNKKTKTSGAF
jgi:ABC-type Zn2+ transport system substrate-binding protein/surface adhesin